MREAAEANMSVEAVAAVVEEKCRIQERDPYAAWRSIGEPRTIVSPMVDQSELPFRLLCRKYGADMAFTPMLHAHVFLERVKYREKNLASCADDHPLVVQFCGHDPDVLVAAAKLVEPVADAIDFNLGCPQGIARRGYYGAFLMDDLALIESCVRNLVRGTTKPVSCKIRIFPDVNDSIAYARMLERCGIAWLTVHGRLREIKGPRYGPADWNQIRLIKESLKIPVIANGNISCYEDIERCLEYTKADAVMSAECLLWNPGLFSRDEFVNSGPRRPPVLKYAAEYIALAEKYPQDCRPSNIRSHLFRLLGDYFKEFPETRQYIYGRKMMFETLYELLDVLKAKQLEKGSTWYPPSAYTKHSGAGSSSNLQKSQTQITDEENILRADPESNDNIIRDFVGNEISIFS